MLVLALILVLSIAAGLALMVVMRRLSGGRPYFGDTSMAGGAFGAVRGPFAVLLAFVIFLAFQGYTRARTAASNEASAVLTMARTSELLPAVHTDELRKDLLCYSRAVIEDEWPAMREGRESDLVDHWLLETELGVAELRVHGAVQEEALSEFFAETSMREEARDDRLVEADGVVPTPVWIVLIIGGAMIVIYMGFFADPRERMLSQAVMMGTTVAVIASGLLLIAFFDHPYADRAGGLEPTAMERTLQKIETERAVESAKGEPPCDESGKAVGGD